MECRAVLNSLSEYIDGPGLWTSESEIRAIETHLQSCSKCEMARMELMEIRTAARELPMHTPPKAMWNRIQNVLEAELPRSERPTRIEPANLSWWERMKSRKFVVSMPQLAGAGALAMALLVAGGYFLPASTGRLNLSNAQSALLPEEFELRTEIERRMAAIESRMNQWDPQTRADFEQNLNKIDESLKACREKLKENPQDAVHQTTLRSLYQEKRQLLVDVERLKW